MTPLCVPAQAAICNVGLEFPIDRITVNPAPADEGRLIPSGACHVRL